VSGFLSKNPQNSEVLEGMKNAQWQIQRLDEIKNILHEHEAVQALILKGSCADDETFTDQWSDIEMAQETIVLQMLLRDREKQTTIHRTGDFEKVQILNRFSDWVKDEIVR
jgi:hypothetical protein